MVDFKRRGVLPFVIFSSVIFSSCQLANQIKLPISVSEKMAEGPWVKEGNIYSTTLKYDSPGGAEINKVNLKIENDVITGMDFEVITEIKTSIRYQEQFAKELPKIIVGKKLSELKEIDKVSGASLTTNAFNEALQKLQQQI